MKPRKIVELVFVEPEVSPDFTVEIGEAGKLEPPGPGVQTVVFDAKASEALSVSVTLAPEVRFHTLH